jgi:hypothetical protein
MAIRKLKRPSPPASRGVASIVMDTQDDMIGHYVNHIEVAHTKHEFTLTCGKLPAKLSPVRLQMAKESGEVHLEPMLQLVIPPTIMPGLISALTSQLEKYEQKNGLVQDSSNWNKERAKK